MQDKELFNTSCQEETSYHLQLINQVGRDQDFNDGWRFIRADLRMAQEPFFDDSDWKSISLPHDFSIIQPYTRNGEAESAYKLGGIGWYRKLFAIDSSLRDHQFNLHFDGAYMEVEVYLNGHLVGKHFNGYLAFSYDITSFILFGQENLLAVRVENQVPSSRWYSGSGLYRQVSFSVVPKLHFDKNQLCLELLETAHKNARQTSLSLSFGLSQLIDSSKYQLGVRLSECLSDGKLGQIVHDLKHQPLNTIADSEIFNLVLSVNDLKLWSPSSPNLYCLELNLYQERKIVDTIKLETGFRQIHFDANDGFFLNGDPVKLKGVCLHHDQGSLGACAYPAALERQLLLVKKMGANAVRVTHNPSARHFKKLANRLGLLVIEEAFDTWSYAKNENINDFSRYFHKPIGYQNALYLNNALSANITWAQYSLQSMVFAGRHDPSIIMWSIGNELMEGFSADVSHYPDVAVELCQWILAIDTSRPVTFADNKLKDKQFYWGQEIKTIAEQISHFKRPQGLIGFNYAKGIDYDRLHTEHPNWLLYGSETASAINSRSVYQVKGNHHTGYQLTSYDQSTVAWGSLASEAWYDTITRDFVAGEFVWTGFDYLGEPTPWNKINRGAVNPWPSPKQSYFGIFDTAGFPKDTYYFYQSQWSNKPTLHLLPNWQENQVCPDENGLVEVVVYSNASKVRLVFEDFQGKKTDYGQKCFSKQVTKAGHCYQMYQGTHASEVPHQNLYLTWKIPFQLGKLTAIAYDDQDNRLSDTDGRCQVISNGNPECLRWTAFKDYQQDRSNQLLYLTLDVLDQYGEVVVTDEDLITIDVQGPAQLLALDNGNPCDYQPYQTNHRKVYRGKLLAIIALTGQTGQVIVTANSSQLDSTTYRVEVSKRSQTSQSFRYSLNKYQFKSYFCHLNLQSHADKGRLIEDRQVSQKRIHLSGTPVNLLSYTTFIKAPLSFDRLVQHYWSGDDIILPEWLQVRDVMGVQLAKAFPVFWQLNEKRFSQEQTVVGQINCFSKWLNVEADLRYVTKKLHPSQNFGLVAKKEVVYKTPTSICYRYQYDTLQALGAISFVSSSETLEQVRVSLQIPSESQSSNIVINLPIIAITQEEQMITLTERVDILILEVTLEWTGKVLSAYDDLIIGLWNLKEEK
ncbi:glycoside hydrolase family 2 TIM barrel-domain containing protein [Streptococcus castoreus]|uniref:glycoside hydrolase family 2 TIM barrel-domain containing protein n=1 Tax=Streptococcus castoreus TaxID=254786 RepID=UPI0004064A98|nr:glycoside hydrolase family 2 TIM barrel-domain containing protein [Streptococcus castoreus]